MKIKLLILALCVAIIGGCCSTNRPNMGCSNGFCSGGRKPPCNTSCGYGGCGDRPDYYYMYYHPPGQPNTCCSNTNAGVVCDNCYCTDPACCNNRCMGSGRCCYLFGNVGAR